MGNTVSDAQKTTARTFVTDETNNNNNVQKTPHGFNTAGMNPPPECPMHVKVEEKKPAAASGCAVAGSTDDINPLNMVCKYLISIDSKRYKLYCLSDLF